MGSRSGRGAANDTSPVQHSLRHYESGRVVHGTSKRGWAPATTPDIPEGALRNWSANCDDTPTSPVTPYFSTATVASPRDHMFVLILRFQTNITFYQDTDHPCSSRWGVCRSVFLHCLSSHYLKCHSAPSNKVVLKSSYSTNEVVLKSSVGTVFSVFEAMLFCLWLILCFCHQRSEVKSANFPWIGSRFTVWKNKKSIFIMKRTFPMLFPWHRLLLKLNKTHSEIFKILCLVLLHFMTTSLLSAPLVRHRPSRNNLLRNNFSKRCC